MEGPSFDHFERDDADARKPSFAGRAVKFVGVVFIVAAVVVFQQAADGPARSFAGGGWSTDWDAVEQASQSGKPSLVLFTADWCPGCRSFESDVLARADVREYLESRYTLVLVDVSRRDSPNQVLAKQCNIEVLPTLILYKRGIEVARSYGLSADELVKWLRSDGRAVRQFIER